MVDPPADLGTSAAAGSAAMADREAGKAPAAQPGEEPPRRRPASCTELFCAFTWLALQGFGGVLAVAQRELVERRRWLTRAEFLELLSAAQVLPGPNVVNLSLMVGDRFHGGRGAWAAAGGMLALPLAVVLVLAVLYARHAHLPAVEGALRGMGLAAAGLVLGTACKLLAALRGSRLGRPVCAAMVVGTVVAVAVWRLPLAAVLGVLGPLAVGWAWRQTPP